MKKYTNKFISIVLTLIISLSLLTVVSSAATKKMSLVVDNVSAKPGEAVTVKISLKDNPGLASLKINVNYDNKLTLTKVDLSSDFGSYITTPTPYKNPQTISMISPLKDVKISGVLATLTFKVAKEINDTYKAKVWVKYDADDVFDGNYDSVPLDVIDGSVTVIGKQTTQNHTVIFDTNDGSTNTTQSIVPMNEKIKLPSPTKKGYTCVGWSESKDAVLPEFKCGTEITPSSDLSLYAVWAKNDTKVTGVSVNDVSLNYKDIFKITPTVNSTNGAKYVVEWSSSDTEIATVDQSGTITATKRGKGSAIITCKVTDQFGNVVTDTCKVTVSLTAWQWVKTYIFFGWIWY